MLGYQESGGEFPSLVLVLGKFDVGDMPAFRAVKVAVLLQVGAKAGRFPIDMDGLHQAAANHGLKAVVDRGERDRGHPLLGADKDLRGRGVIPLVHQHLVDLTTLRRQPQSSLHHCRRVLPHRALVGGNR